MHGTLLADLRAAIDHAARDGDALPLVESLTWYWVNRCLLVQRGSVRLDPPGSVAADLARAVEIGEDGEDAAVAAVGDGEA